MASYAMLFSFFINAGKIMSLCEVKCSEFGQLIEIQS